MPVCYEDLTQDKSVCVKITYNFIIKRRGKHRRHSMVDLTSAQFASLHGGFALVRRAGVSTVSHRFGIGIPEMNAVGFSCC